MKRTTLLCVLAGIMILGVALPAFARVWPLPPVSYPGKVALYRVAVQNPGAEPVPQAPAFIDYTLNAKADIKVEILPSDSAGVPTGAGAVRTENLVGVDKGKRLYLWPCVLDDGVTMAPPNTYYIARLTATSTKTRWDANIGLYINWQIPTDGRWRTPPKDEWGYRSQAYDTATLLPAWERDTAGELVLDSAGNPIPIMTVYYPSDRTPPMGGPPGQGKDESLGGFYGVGVNKNPGSPYLGRIYAAHQITRHVYVYDVDGTYLGMLDDTGVTWMTSSPWDMVIAEDDYIYVSDRTQMTVNCFQPFGGADGVGLIKSISPGYTNDRAMGGGWVDSAGVTHFVISSGQYLYPFTLAANHTSWSSRGAAMMSCTGTGDSTALYGTSYDTSHNIIYAACLAGDFIGVRKWTKPVSGNLWNNVADWRAPRDTAGTVIARGCMDVEIASYDSAGQPATLWITTFSGSTNDIYLVDAATGNQIDRGSLVYYGFMLCQDPVGNVLVGFGKSAGTWPSKYLGMFSGAGVSTAQKDTGAFFVPEDPSPVLVGGSESWLYGDASGELIPDDTDTAEVSFQVVDANGYSDIGAIELDLKELRNTADTTILTVTSVTPNANPLTADCKATVTAKNGVQYGTRGIGLKAYDSDNPTKYTSGTFGVKVAGNQYTATITHTLSSGAISDALMKFVGGKPGVYGYPFTYYGVPSDILGGGYAYVSEGVFDVTAEKVGYNTQALKTESSPPVESGGFPIGVSGGLKLGPLSVAQARLLTNKAVYASIVGLTYGRPQGLAPTLCTGLDTRCDAQLTVADPGPPYVAPTFSVGKSWYMCDPGSGGASSGLQFQLKVPDTAFVLQWDNSTIGIPTPPFTKTYIGKRPDVGESICVSGWLETRPGYETRMWVDDANAKIATLADRKIYYYNLTQYAIGGYGWQAPPTPLSMSIGDVYHDANATYETTWGQYGTVGGTVVMWMPGGLNIGDNWTGTVDNARNNPSRYVVIADSLNNWTTVTFNSLTSLGIPPTGSSFTTSPCDLGDSYTFTGAAGRHGRFGVGTMRVLGTDTIVKTTDRTVAAGANSVDVVRGVSTGSVEFRGIVTAKFGSPSCIYVENADRSVGVRVTGNPTWVRTGDEVWVKGDVLLLDGIKRVIPSQAVTVLNSGNARPYLGMRLHDVGGKDYDVSTDPGITDGRGALNVGLFVTVNGMVTYRDTASSPAFFYIWDGSNMVIPGFDAMPLTDGSTRVISKDTAGNPILDEYGSPTTIEVSVLGTRIAHSGYLGAEGRGVQAWQDWVEIEGIVNVNQSAIPGKTIPEIIPTLITLKTAFDTIAADAETVIMADLSNLISLPSVPAKTGNGIDYQYYDPLWVLPPGSDANPMPWEAQVLLSKGKDVISNKLARWETANQSEYKFNEYGEPFGVFGGVLLGEGYWAFPDAAWGATAISYSGVNKNIPQWIATGSAGWMQIGNSQAHDSRMTIWSDNGTPDNYDDDYLIKDAEVYMSNGAVVHNIEDASPRGLDWLSTKGYYWINSSGSQLSIGCEDDFPNSTTLVPWAGYVFEMKTADKAWIIK